MRQASINTSTYDRKTRNLHCVLYRKIKPLIARALPLVMAAVVLQATGCGTWVDDHLCGSAGCQWSDDEWGRLSALSGLPDTAPPDASNRYVGDPTTETHNKKKNNDTRNTKPTTQEDQLK